MSERKKKRLPAAAAFAFGECELFCLTFCPDSSPRANKSSTLYRCLTSNIDVREEKTALQREKKKCDVSISLTHAPILAAETFLGAASAGRAADVALEVAATPAAREKVAAASIFEEKEEE